MGIDIKSLNPPLQLTRLNRAHVDKGRTGRTLRFLGCGLGLVELCDRVLYPELGRFNWRYLTQHD
ncbi:hypothetical protein MC7420_935 [Coleofasciculus chthonoplastes PCC 7420]|uniref:Uncharacterized protein n=1 Tax=Coleofasciculus chthonoplastes PCC 7420 TaxID=118168 RepID=B4W0C3_9CYAN|nr:hypothetical protein [Coleofasciculus chthonoplastes]EDX72266.1 hypothetical protein MC7420_935 [Coleofasciculus chthonoplastes PCC 7420]